MAEQRLPVVDGDDGQWGDILNQFIEKEHYNTGLDNPVNGGHQKVTLQPGTTGAGTAPLKFTSGPLMTAPEAGAIEFLTDRLYFTQTTNATRKIIAAYDDTSGAGGDMYYRDTNGNIVRFAVGSDGDVIQAVDGVPTWGGVPAVGADGHIQFANSGVMTSNTSFTYDSVNSRVVIGPDATVLPNNPLALTGTVDSYLQVNLQNKSAGESASADYIITADNGDDSQNYADFGLNNSGYNNPDWDAAGPNDSYLMVDGGNLVLGSLTTTKKIRFFVAGTDHESHPEDIVAELSDTGLNLRADSAYTIGGADILQSDYDRHSSGVVSGGLITKGTTGTVNIASGVGWAWDGAKFVRVTWSNFTNQAPYQPQYNYVSIDHDGALQITGSEQTGSAYIRLGKFVYDSGSGFINTVWSIADIVGDYQQLNSTFLGEVFGTIIAKGFSVAEKSTPKLQLDIEGGEMYSRLNDFSYGTIGSTYTSTFAKLFGHSTAPITKDMVNNDNTIDTTLWNDITQIEANALVTMTTDYWAKALVVMGTDGVIKYIYPRAEYATEDAAKAAPLPYADTLFDDANAFLCTIVFQEGDTTIANRISDIRPLIRRVFGSETSVNAGGMIISHSALTNLSNDDHSQYHNDARANTWLDAKTLADIADDTTHRTVTDTEKSTWNSKEDASNKVTSISGSSTDVQYPSAKLLYDQLQDKADSTDIEAMMHSDSDRHSSGVVSGGLVTKGTTGTVNVSAGIGWAWDGTGFTRVVWSDFTNQAAYQNGYNFVSIYHDGTLNITATEQTTTAYIRLGKFVKNGGSGNVDSIWGIADKIGNYQQLNSRFLGEVFGTIIATGFRVTEKATPDLQLDIEAGCMFAQLNEFDYGTLGSTYTSTFSKLFGCLEDNITKDLVNNDNTIDTTLWNDTSLTHDSALVTMTTDYWAKALVVMGTDGVVKYIYPQGEYATEDLAKAAPLPFADTLFDDSNAFLATIVFQEGDTTIANRIIDIRPLLRRIFGSETSVSAGGTIVDHGTLTGLSDDDHSIYHNDSRALTWLGGRSTNDLPDSSNKRYVSDAYLTLLSNTSGTNTGDVDDASITTTDVTTNNASTSKHGWFPKLPTATGKFLRDDMSWQTAPGGGGGHTPTAVWGDSVEASSVVVGTTSYVRVPYSGTITSWSIIANASSTTVLDVWKVNAALPTVANTITASAKPSLSTATTASSSTLTGWTTAVTAGDVFGFKLDSLTGTPTSITLVLNVE